MAETRDEHGHNNLAGFDFQFDNFLDRLLP